MKIDRKSLLKSPEKMAKIIEDLHRQLEVEKAEKISYKEKYVRLIEEIRLAKYQRFSSSSEKNVLQADLFDEAGVELPEELQDQLEDDVENNKKPKKKHPVRRPLPKDLPREIILHDISDAEKKCACGACLVRIGEEITEQLKYIPAQLSVVQHVRPKYACKPCAEHVKIAPMPLLLLPKCMVAPELVAHTIVSKYADHVPLYRQQAIWSRLDIDLPRSSLCGWILKVAELCEPLISCMQQKIIEYDYAQADETPVQVLNEVGRDNQTKSYMWVYRGGGEKPCLVYEYQPTRGGYHAEKFLTGFKGYLQTDAYSGYHFAAANPSLTQVGCMAHARRKFADILKIAKTNGLATEALKFIRQLYAIEKTAREKNMLAEERYRYRQEKSVPILTAYKQWRDVHLTKTSEQAKIGNAIRYSLSNWNALNAYLNLNSAVKSFKIC